MSGLLMALLIGTILASIALLAAMYIRDKPLYGAIAIIILDGPSSVLTLAYYSLTQG